MKIHSLYLGTWLPRTSIHLKEVFRFLQNRHGIPGLKQSKINALHTALGVQAFKLHEERDSDFLEAAVPHARFMLTEEGILLIKRDAEIAATKEAFLDVRNKLLDFNSLKLGPALKYLFSLGAPIPRDLADVKTVLPFIAVVLEASEDDIRAMYAWIGEREISVNAEAGMEIHRLPSLTILHITDKEFSLAKLEDFIQHDIFFREFEFLLEEYLLRHRTHWEEISRIRESRSIRFRDFSDIRKKLFEIRQTIVYIRSRLLQMQNILKERSQTISHNDVVFLKKLGLNRFAPLESAQEYTAHLWDATLEYLDGTIRLFQTLYEENTQRELAVIKVTTFAAALAGFFGMNIGFPWEERWFMVNGSSFIVASIVIVTPIVLYFVLKQVVMNRRFAMKDKISKIEE